jgi:hypothetical protein
MNASMPQIVCLQGIPVRGKLLVPDTRWEHLRAIGVPRRGYGVLTVHIEICAPMIDALNGLPGDYARDFPGQIYTSAIWLPADCPSGHCLAMAAKELCICALCQRKICF